MNEIRIGLLGCGHVGAALVELIDEQRQMVQERTGARLTVKRVAVRSATRRRDVALDPAVFTTDAREVVEDPDVDLVVEVMGGIEPARDLVRRAIELDKPVVSANKELLANHGAELFAAADEAGVDLLFEAAVCGAIPLVRPLRESLIGEPVDRVMGIVNGTTNYILTAMTERGADYHDALAEAQELGYAERDPTADVEGHDAAAKAAIIATIAYGSTVVAGDVYREGISNLTTHDIEMAAHLGYVVKAVAVIERDHRQSADQCDIGVRVHPAMIPRDHPLATVRDSFNAVFIEGGAAGELMLYGRGAGGRPTASAVLGDTIDAAVNLAAGGPGRIGKLTPARIRPIDELETEYYLRLDVADEAGVLARVADVFGRHGVSIRSMEQEGLGEEARLIFITHRARESAVQETLGELRGLDAVHDLRTIIRVIGSP